MRTVALFLLLPAILRADDVVLTDGTIFHNATIVSHTSTTASITFADGAAMVRLDRLDATALLKVAKQPVSDSPVPANQQPAATTTGPVSETPQTNAAEAPPVKIDSRIVPKVDAAALNAKGVILQVKDHGCVIQLTSQVSQEKIVPHSKSSTVNIVPGGLGHTPVNQVETQTWTTTEVETVDHQLGVVFLSCPTDFLFEGGRWKGQVWKIGTTNSANTVMPRYTAIAKEAYAYFSDHPDLIPASGKADEHLYDTPVQSSSSLNIAPMK